MEDTQTQSEQVAFLSTHQAGGTMQGGPPVCDFDLISLSLSLSLSPSLTLCLSLSLSLSRSLPLSLSLSLSLSCRVILFCLISPYWQLLSPLFSLTEAECE